MNRARISPSQSERICMVMTLGAGAWLIVLAAVWVGGAVLQVIGGAQ
jgi:hypothetical protein